MKLRKHKRDFDYTITWTEAPTTRVETCPLPGGKTRRTYLPPVGVEKRKQSITVRGSSPTSAIKAFLFGRNKSAILASLVQVYPKVTNERYSSATYGNGRLFLDNRGCR